MKLAAESGSGASGFNCLPTGVSVKRRSARNYISQGIERGEGGREATETEKERESEP
jgi:hypothetical protein